jgi:hypothetical protein
MVVWRDERMRPCFEGVVEPLFVDVVWQLRLFFDMKRDFDLG